ncbi:MAG: hypothetical protein ACT4OZ_13970, partial [Gemmatimonadota bacterium]
RGGKKMWCVAELDAAYIAKMEDVLALYERPYDPAEPVVCLDDAPGAGDARPRARGPRMPMRGRLSPGHQAT